jgi:secreted trypsin-like serine protease
MCGAVLIGPRFVLSAAHCAGAADSLVIGARTSPLIGLASVDYQEMLVHPNYQDARFDFDIMIYYLNEPVTNVPYLTLGMSPIATVGQQLTVVGFGDTRGGGSGRLFLSDILMETEVSYVDPETCSKAHGKDPITEDMLCAKGSDTDACYGDSGGPLILKGDTIAQDTLAGLVSWGKGEPNLTHVDGGSVRILIANTILNHACHSFYVFRPTGCADPHFPGVYTRISYFYDWVVQNVCERDQNGAPDYMNCAQLLSTQATADTTQTPMPTPWSTPQPTLVPTPSPAPQCGDRGSTCGSPTDCCSNRCRIGQCVPSNDTKKDRLTDGVLGGQSGGASPIRRDPNLFEEMFEP